jgi:dTDP-4-dehydrorhamnose reductase
MQVLVLGATGMAGREFYKHLKTLGYNVVGVARSGSDVSADISDKASLLTVLASGAFDAIVNAAALVDIAECDSDPLKGWMTNTAPLAMLANWSLEFEIPLLHISTDHFYPYGESKAHTETDPVFFLNGYAQQKYAAEALALASPHALVLRTSIIGRRGSGAQSLVEWAISSLLQGKEIQVFCDAWTSSIDVQSFARFAWQLFAEKNARGLLNLASSEVYSKEDLIRKIAQRLKVSQAKLMPVSIKTVLPNRPHCLGLDVSKAEEVLGCRLPTMVDTLDRLMREIQNIQLGGTVH